MERKTKTFAPEVMAAFEALFEIVSRPDVVWFPIQPERTELGPITERRADPLPMSVWEREVTVTGGGCTAIISVSTHLEDKSFWSADRVHLERTISGFEGEMNFAPVISAIAPSGCWIRGTKPAYGVEGVSKAIREELSFKYPQRWS